jgi:hypothetical protein
MSIRVMYMFYISIKMLLPKDKEAFLIMLIAWKCFGVCTESAIVSPMAS